MNAKVSHLTPVQTGLTQTTVQSLRKVFALLEDHFEPANGCYINDYSDERIAKECGISVSGVTKYRIDGFGKIKPPSEFHVLTVELRELETLYLKLDNELKNGIKDLKARIGNLQKRFD